MTTNLVERLNTLIRIIRKPHAEFAAYELADVAYELESVVLALESALSAQPAAQQEPVAWFCVNSVTGKMLYTDSRDESANMRDQKKGFWTVTPLFSGKPETPAAPVSPISTPNTADQQT